jgi:hypothetical protein
VHLVDNGVGEGGSRCDIPRPVKGRIGDDAQRGRTGRVGRVLHGGLVHVVAENGLAPGVVAGDGGGVGVEQKLVRVVAQSVGRVPGAVDAESVTGSHLDTVDDAVEHVAGALAQPGCSLHAVLVEGAEVDRVGRLGVNRDVNAGFGALEDGDTQGIRTGERRAYGHVGSTFTRCGRVGKAAGWARLQDDS